MTVCRRDGRSLDWRIKLVQNTTIAANKRIGVKIMEKYVNSIHYLAATVIEYGKNVDDGV